MTNALAALSTCLKGAEVTVRAVSVSPSPAEAWPVAAAAVVALETAAAEWWHTAREHGPETLAYPDQVDDLLRRLHLLAAALDTVGPRVLALGGQETTPRSPTRSAFARAHSGAVALTQATAVSLALHTHPATGPVTLSWACRLATTLHLPEPADSSSGREHEEAPDLWDLWEADSQGVWFADQPAQLARALYPSTPNDPHPAWATARATVAAWVGHSLGLRHPGTTERTTVLRAPVALAATGTSHGKTEHGEIRDLVVTPHPVAGGDRGFLLPDPAGALTPLGDDLVAAVHTQWLASGAEGGLWRLDPHTPRHGHHAHTPHGRYGIALTGPSLAGAARALFEARRLELPHDPDTLVVAGVTPDNTLTGMGGIAAKLAAWQASDPGHPVVLGPDPFGQPPATGPSVFYPPTLTSLVDHTTFHLRPTLRSALTTAPPLTPPLDEALLGTTSRGASTRTGEMPPADPAAGPVAWVEPTFAESPLDSGDEVPGSGLRRWSWAALLGSLAAPTGLGHVVVVTGGPGQGKTTLARRLHAALLEKASPFPDGPTPRGLPVTLRASAFHTADLEAVLTAHLAERVHADRGANGLTGGANLAAHTATWLASDPSAVLVVDAVDQAGHEHVSHLLRALPAWAGRVVLLGRPHIADHPLPQDHTHLRIADLAPRQAEDLAASYLRSAGLPDAQAAAQARALVRQPGAQALAASPLLVVLHAWWHTHLQGADAPGAPPARSHLYHGLLRVLAARDPEHPAVHDIGKADELIDTLAEALAAWALANPAAPPRGPLPGAELRRRLRESGYTAVEAAAVLDSLTARRVLFALPGGLFDTAHPTLFEHLAAHGLAAALARADHPLNRQPQLRKTVERHIDTVAGNPDHDVLLAHLVGLTRMLAPAAHEAPGPGPTPAESVLQLVAGYRKPGKKAKQYLDGVTPRDNLAFHRHRSALHALRELPPSASLHTRTGHHITRRTWEWFRFWHRAPQRCGDTLKRHLDHFGSVFEYISLEQLEVWFPAAHAELVDILADPRPASAEWTHLRSLVQRMGSALPPRLIDLFLLRAHDPAVSDSDLVDAVGVVHHGGGEVPAALADMVLQRARDPRRGEKLVSDLASAQVPLPAPVREWAVERIVAHVLARDNLSWLAYTLFRSPEPLPPGAVARIAAAVESVVVSAAPLERAVALVKDLSEKGGEVPESTLDALVDKYVAAQPVNLGWGGVSLPHVVRAQRWLLSPRSVGRLCEYITEPGTSVAALTDAVRIVAAGGGALTEQAARTCLSVIRTIGEDVFEWPVGLCGALAEVGVPLPAAVVDAVVDRLTAPGIPLSKSRGMLRSLFEMHAPLSPPAREAVANVMVSARGRADALVFPALASAIAQSPWGLPEAVFTDVVARIANPGANMGDLIRLVLLVAVAGRHLPSFVGEPLARRLTAPNGNDWSCGYVQDMSQALSRVAGGPPSEVVRLVNDRIVDDTPHIRGWVEALAELGGMLTPQAEEAVRAALRDERSSASLVAHLARPLARIWRPLPPDVATTLVRWLCAPPFFDARESFFTQMVTDALSNSGTTLDEDAADLISARYTDISGLLGPAAILAIRFRDSKVPLPAAVVDTIVRALCTELDSA